MSTTLRLPSGQAVTRHWNGHEFEFTFHGTDATVCQHDVAALCAFLEPTAESGETGRSTSTPAPEPSTGPEDKTPVERPDSNKSGRSDVLPYDERQFYTLVVSELPACTTCNRVGHLAADCPNEGGSRGKA